MNNIEKAIEIRNARIRLVSLVDKAANLQSFLVTKNKDGEASFTTCGQIVKADADNHYVTGIVYEPMVKDSQGNFMTEDEIVKAARWYAKNGNMVDVQHSFSPLSSASVVESWVAKADFSLGDKAVKKGTWLMTVEISDDKIWNRIEKGEITGFSMGGVGEYATEDVDIDNLEKSFSDATPKKRRGIIKTLLSLLDGEKQEETEVTKDEMKAIVSETIEKSAGSIAAEVAKIIKEEAQAADSGTSQASSEEKSAEADNTKDAEKKEEPLTKEEIGAMITQAVKEAVPAMLKEALAAQRGTTQQSDEADVNKSKDGAQKKHYLAGII